jgi:two-component system, chemotaxis family, chemotaxis protein CheY
MEMSCGNREESAERLSEQRPSGVGATAQKGLDASVALLGKWTECMATRNLRTPSILLMSNSVDERDVYTRALRASGYSVVNAATTVLAYQIAIARPTDIVVTDGHCAGSMSGLELTRRLRTHTRTATVPIIVITSEMRRQDGELSIKAGASMFLERPVSGEVLREHVARLLVACGRLPRQVSPKHEPLGYPGDNPHREYERTCPQCSGVMEYRHKSPVLSAVDPNRREPRERLSYVSGWFCCDQDCGYQELARRTG